MPDNLPVFMLAVLILVAVPGPDVLYITARGIDQGKIAAVLSACSCALGGLVLTLAGALGLSAVLESSAVAFAAVKYVGAAYLVILGAMRLLRSDREGVPQQVDGGPPLSQVFAQGFMVSVLNPKTALFFAAFLPQFVNPAAGSIRIQLILLGLILVGMGLCTDMCYALLSGSLGQRFLRYRFFSGPRRYLTGGTYLVLGLAAAITRPLRAAAASPGL